MRGTMGDDSENMKTLAIGVAGLGRAFSLMAPTFAADPRVRLVAAADPRPEALERFRNDFPGTAHPSVEALCADPQVEVVYVATPHQFHAAHARLAAGGGKHVLVEKPMALDLDECRAMIRAARDANVRLIVGHSHSFDQPVLATRRLIDSGEFGRVRMITAVNFTDYLYRPRRPEELDTSKGGGAVFNQAAHQVDVVRMLAGARAVSVRAATGAWDPSRPTEGAYSCLINFADGTFATLVYSGYAHFDSDELMDGIGELGRAKNPAQHGDARSALSSGDEQRLKDGRNYGGTGFAVPEKATSHEHFGPVVVSCERADLRPLPDRIEIHGDAGRRTVTLEPPRIPRIEVIDELYDAVVHHKPPVHDGEWAAATLEVCLAILRSGREAGEITLTEEAAAGA
jgi:phthalate 4,5-cis-dihydrodiol dehydrogenase